MRTDELIQTLESHWDADGFLDAVRRGKFDPDAGRAFLDYLHRIAIDEDELVPKRLLSLLWYLPLFLEWQKARIEELNPSEVASYGRFVTEVHNILEEVLGIP
jgi:hypothetical protein